MSTRILVAGIGNIFHGDDAFGCEVVRQLVTRDLPEGVDVKDYGIRSFDLAFAMLEPYSATVLVDATPRGGEPGTLYLLRLDMEDLEQMGAVAIEGHSMNPVKVLQLVKTYGGQPERLYLVGCEPQTLESIESPFELSPPVRGAIKEAIEMVESLVERLFVEIPFAQPQQEVSQ